LRSTSDMSAEVCQLVVRRPSSAFAASRCRCLCGLGGPALPCRSSCRDGIPRPLTDSQASPYTRRTSRLHCVHEVLAHDILASEVLLGLLLTGFPDAVPPRRCTGIAPAALSTVADQVEIWSHNRRIFPTHEWPLQ
jgi:hypothetical protein